MTAQTFLAVTGSEIARAAREPDGGWRVDLALQNEGARCLAVDPLQPGTVYAGTQAGAVLRSADGGLGWARAGSIGQIVTCLAVSPHEPGLLYAGTKPALTYVSRDGGRSWTELEGFRKIRGRWLWFSPAEPPDLRAYVQAIAISPSDPSVLLVGIEFGAVVCSEDGGRTWSNHLRGSLRDCHSLRFHARDGDWAYEAGGTGGGASASRDGGRTWRKAKAGLAKYYGVACAADPQRPEIWYVSVAPGPGKAYGQTAEAYFYRAEGGAGWKPIGWEPHPMAEMPIALATDPDAPGHLYAGTVRGNVWHTPDHGESWHKLPFQLPAIWRSLVMVA